MERIMKHLAIFVSGSGTNMDNIIKKVACGVIKGACVSVVLSDKEHAPALAKAQRQGVETLFIDPKKFADKETYEKAIVKELRKRKIDYIILAGFMRILTPYLVRTYKNRMLNVHPSLLPAFKGAHGIKDAYEYGVKIAGVTVHFVTDDLDGGPIIVQRALEVKKNETLESLEKRIHAVEYALFPEAINLVVKGKVKVARGKVLFV